MRRPWILVAPLGCIVVAACVGGDRGTGETPGIDAGGSDGTTSSGDGDAGADAERPCGHPGEDCCPAPAVPCRTGTVCASGNDKCMISELGVVGEYVETQPGPTFTRHLTSAFYDGKDWTIGPDVIIDSNWWSATDLVSSAPGNYYVTIVRHGVEGSRDEGKLFNFHSGLWHKCEPGQPCVGPTVPSRPFWSVASIADETWIGAEDGLYRCVPGGSCTNQNTGLGGSSYRVVGTGPQDIWSVGGHRGVHFDGTKWTVHDNIKALRIFEVRQDDVWVAGATLGEGPKLQHWDGKAWSTEYAIDGAPVWAIIQSMSGSSSTDIWAVGSGAFAAHWDGKKWSYEPLPAATAGSSSVFSVYAPSPIEAFVATGSTGVYRWDGAQWTKMTMPTVDAGAGAQPSWDFITGPAKPRP